MIVVEVVIPALLCHIDILTPFYFDPVTIPINIHDSKYMIEALLIKVLFLISRSPFFPELHSYYMSCVQTDYVY